MYADELGEATDTYTIRESEAAQKVSMTEIVCAR
jgi:hypothetical protein